LLQELSLPASAANAPPGVSANASLSVAGRLASSSVIPSLDFAMHAPFAEKYGE
jgi:hypothetical protein